MARSLAGKITITAVRSLEPGDELRDSELKGFGVRRQSATVSYFVHTRINGRLKRLTIGRHGSPWTPETARKEAARLLVNIRSGQNPAQERDDRRRISDPFEVVAEEFIKVHGKRLKPRTREEYTRLIRLQLGRAFHGRPISEIKPADVARAHASWSDTPRAANHAIAVLSKLLSWAEQHGYCHPGPNPCSTVDRYKENKRDRYLSEEELVRLGAALAEAEAADENPWVIGIIRLLILTGARLSEMLTLRWEYLDAGRRALRLPDSKTGAKTVYLSPEALAVVCALPRIDGNPWVFPGHVDGNHIVNIQKPWRALRSRAGLDDVRLHDLRHSFASISIEAGGTLPVIGHLLGHTQAQTTHRYAHVAPHPAQRIADAAGARIARAWTTRDPSAPTGSMETSDTKRS
jgi:integrase